MDEDHYGMPPDLRQFINNTTRPLFISPIPPPPPPQQQQQAEFMLSPPHHGGGRDLARSHHSYDVAMPPPSRGGFHHEFLAESAATPGAAGFGGLEMEAPGGGGNGRWPRQETLTLLEIRSRLDYKFKEANQKGPLWDEVSRIMSEEHGYERSGKKCREKFENLYKYYKKTKDGKGGRQDGKHYRFFRQLEALYGGDTCAASVSETHSTFRYNDDRNLGTLTAAINGNNPGALMMSADCSLSLSDSSDYDTSSSDDIIGGQGDEASAAGGKRRKGKGRWKGKIKEFIDGQMRKLMEKQEAWLEKIMKTIEKKEQERTAREEEWRRKEAARMETEQAFWANERAWIKARDSALMDALHKASNIAVAASSEATSEDDTWTEGEVSKLVQIRNSMGPRFDNHTHQNVVVVGGNNFYDDDDEALWEEIATKMSYLGYDRSGAMCREKWLHCINNNYVMMNQCNKKRKDYNNPGGESCYYMDPDNGGGSYGNCPMEQQQQQQQQKDMSVESCFRLLMGDHCETVWDNYGLKLNDRRN